MIKQCKQCEIEFTCNESDRMFCSKSCAGKFNNKNRIHSQETKNKIRSSINNFLSDSGYKKRTRNNAREIIDGVPQNICKKCGYKWCDKSIRTVCDTCKKEHKHNKYVKFFRTPKSTCIVCGNPCVNKFCSVLCSSNEVKRKTFLKIESGVYKSSNPTQYKRYLIETRGHQCEICKQTEWMGQPIPLVMDHINGRSSENNLDNLRLVCGNCDMQLPTYKSKNKNSDRKSRK